ncbi:hypothetical protein DFQ11_101585 [Winogradskyella epiphytica]|uniref:Uncharacterized protein n=1 Tax=Winogradskyella epiphytica TaxID=262005 RepID=A0A2V4Y2Q4_9FLAO|nr:hypothetical protein [Winogradskyella epiphytica]PYE83154.1 hypothetical protein DFQ11_101585 [Winogradskyella epiphytica]GGW56202.1 hypothetical protein GCM10008085_04520 [Winogradskyella epiphytica]
MNKKLRNLLKTSLINGLLYAVIMACFDYSDGLDFRICRFLINAMVIGPITGLIIFYSIKKQGTQEKSNK